MSELKLYNILDSDEYKSIKDIVKNLSTLEIAAVNTYNVYCKKMESNVKVCNFPSLIDYLCIVQDEKENPLVVSFKSAYDILKKGKSVKCKIVEFNPHLKNMKNISYLYKLFSFNKEVSLDENISRKLMFICKASSIVKDACENVRGVTCDYARMLMTEFMNEYSYELYNRYSIDLDRVCRFLMTQEVYSNLEVALEIICTGEAIRLGKDDFELYDKLPKYNFIHSFLKKGMRVKEIMRLFEGANKKQIHKSRLAEFIQGKEVMIDYKNPDVPVYRVAILN